MPNTWHNTILKHDIPYLFLQNNNRLVNLKAVKLCLYDFEQGEMIERRFGSKDWIVALLYVNN